MRAVVILLACISAAISAPSDPERIAGGSLTTINVNPFMAVLLYSMSGTSFTQNCAASVLNSNKLLTSGSCVGRNNMPNWRIRVGSSFATSGGSVYYVGAVIPHHDNNVDLAILSPPTIIINSNVRPVTFAPTDHPLPANAAMWAIGWGALTNHGVMSEQMRRVSVSRVAIQVCKDRYANAPNPFFVHDNMLCAGGGARDQCQGDTGGPLIHNNMLVGVCSVRPNCAQANMPGINTLVSEYSAWIKMNL